MIANPAIPHTAAVSNLSTLNDLRMQRSIKDKPAISAMTLSGAVLAAVLAIGTFIWLDPLRLFTPTDASPLALTVGPSAEPAGPTERQEIIAPLIAVPTTKSVEVPIAPTGVVPKPHDSAPVVRPRAASIKPESRGTPMETNTTFRRASPEEKTTPPVLLTKPEETKDAPIVLKLGDDTRNAPIPAATNTQTPEPE